MRKDSRKKKVKFITLTNDGYLDYTLNCLKSLDQIDFDIKLHCYCLGEYSHDFLCSKGYKSTLLEQESADDSNRGEFRQGNWHNIVKRKFEIIHANLLKHDYVCITDGDIVFLDKKFMDYCFDSIGDKLSPSNWRHPADMLISNDHFVDDNHGNLCTGFMFIKSNESTLSIFNPTTAYEDAEHAITNGRPWGDQVYINRVKRQLKYKLLPVDLFPNGKHYYGKHENINPYMIHFNRSKYRPRRFGRGKKAKMMYFKKWFL